MAEALGINVDNAYFWLAGFFVFAGALHPVIGFIAAGSTAWWLGGIYGGLMGAIAFVAASAFVLIGGGLRTSLISWLRPKAR